MIGKSKNAVQAEEKFPTLYGISDVWFYVLFRFSRFPFSQEENFLLPVKRGNGIHEDAQISQNRLCCDREYDQQHDTFSGHIRNGEQLVQIGTAENEGNNRADQDRPAHPVERLADPVENHKTDNGEQYGGSGRNIFRADRKFLAEDDECCDHQKVGQRRRQGPCQNVRDKVALDPVFVRHQREQEAWNTDRKHTDQRDLGRLQRIRHHRDQ